MSHSEFGSRRQDYQGPSFDERDCAADPFVQFDRWFAEAVEAGVVEPEAMALATCHDAQPSVRYVLLRGFDTNGFVFYTNFDSRKSRELAANPSAALAWHWRDQHRQVRAVGSVVRVDDAEADAYFAARPLGARLGAWASPQSSVLQNRAELDAALRGVAERFGAVGLDDDADLVIPRPTNWGGWRLVPTEVEFWQGQPSRLHDRLQFRVGAAGWERVRLAP